MRRKPSRALSGGGHGVGAESALREGVLPQQDAARDLLEDADRPAARGLGDQHLDRGRTHVDHRNGARGPRDFGAALPRARALDLLMGKGDSVNEGSGAPLGPVIASAPSSHGVRMARRNFPKDRSHFPSRAADPRPLQACIGCPCGRPRVDPSACASPGDVCVSRSRSARKSPRASAWFGRAVRYASWSAPPARDGTWT